MSGKALETASLRIGGMTCANCQNRIEGKLKSTPGVEEASVRYGTGTATVTWDPAIIALDGIRAAIESLDYRVLDGNGKVPATEIAGTLVIVIALYVLLRGLGISAAASAFPLAESGMGYGMLLLVGLVTSVHCAAMCGGINLSQTLGGGSPPPAPASSPPRASHGTGPGSSASPPAGDAAPKPPAFRSRAAVLFPSILYNAGRVVSYTVIGIIVGALGSIVSVSGRFQGIVQLAAGTFMVIMGINMLGLFPALRRFNLGLPKFIARKINREKSGGRNPLLVGLLNGLMPCGPLQAMQLYALSTGSPLAGGVSMFLFSMGTVPLMFGIGALGSLLSSAARGPSFTRRVMKIGAVLVTVMGMTMFGYGWGLSGFRVPFADGLAAAVNPLLPQMASGSGDAFSPVIEDGVQILRSTLSPGRYPAITVRRGVPVKWTIDAPQGSINGCNNRMIIREYGIEHRFIPGDNVIEFMPGRTGRFSYSCWMGMIRSSITVVEEGQIAADLGEPGLDPLPAGVAIPAERIALAEIRAEGYQAAAINLRDDGIEPAVVIFQRGIPAVWTINNDSLDPGNSRLVFPAYYTRVDMEQGDNVIQLMPAGDFDFSTGDHVFYGYVKVVDDLGGIDMDALRAEVSEFETMIYPDAWFEAEAQAGCACCGGAGA